MKRNQLKRLMACVAGAGALVCGQGTMAQGITELSLNAKKVGAPIQSTMYGIFFEDINFGADGGLYAELIKNRSFDFPQNLMGWYTFGNVELLSENSPFPNNPSYIKLTPPSHSHKRTGIENEGYRGIGYTQDAEYRFSVWAKKEGAEPQKLKINLINSSGAVIGNAMLTVNSDTWQKYQVVVKANETELRGSVRVFLASGGTVYLDHVSMFPVDTWKGRENGMRKDLAQALDDLNPGVFRFPGGCIVEGTEIDDRYDWKKSVGPVENRPLNSNRWQYTFEDRFFPDYYQSYGLGFYEFFLLSEDMGAEPLPVVNVGLACQYQNDSEHSHIAVCDLEGLIQDALDLIEFANGDPSSPWGGVRAGMGHPAPFNLKYIGVGNEQWGEEYVVRLAPFVKAIRAKYPDIKIIGSSGPSADGREFDYLWPEMARLKVDLVDEHYYKDPKWFLESAARYDNYDRKGPAVFAGEYACHVYEGYDGSIPMGRNNFYSALCESAFMTGLERNADIVHMCTYAPLFAHVDAWQWRPDMIWFDNLKVAKTPNYYVQQMYARNAGTHTMQLLNGKESQAGQNGLYASAVYEQGSNDIIIKVVNTSDEIKDVRITINGLKKYILPRMGEITILKAPETGAINTLESPDTVVPVSGSAAMDGNVVVLKSEPQSFGVYRVKQLTLGPDMK